MNLLATRARKPSAAPRVSSAPSAGPIVKKEEVIPTLDEFIAAQDYTGAVTLLEFLIKTDDATPDTLPWLAYSYFHLGEFQKSLDTYTKLIEKSNGSYDPETQNYYLYSAACHYYLENYNEALDCARKGPANMLQNRILLHCAHKLNDDALLQKCTQVASKGGAEDALALAAVQFASCQYQEATDAYHRVLKEYTDYDAINIYLALCCYKLDHFKFALEFLNKYLAKRPNSATAMNLRACSHFRLFDSQSAAQQLHELSERLAGSALPSPPTIAHNNVVVRGGEDALQTLPPLVDIVPEARFNLVVYHLSSGGLTQAHALVKDLEPTTPQEYIIKGVCYACMHVDEEDPDLKLDYLREAERWLNAVGSSNSEKDTIPGRKCMAQLYFFQQRWADVILYLSSIEEYCGYDPALNYNLGIAFAAHGEFEDALKRLKLVEGPLLQSAEYAHWLCRALVYTGDAAGAWQIYMDTESHYALSLLRSLAADCYKCGQFYYAAKAYDMLCKLDGGQHYSEGRRGACLGVVQQVLAGNERPERVREVLTMLGDEEDADVHASIEAWYGNGK